MMEKTEVAVRCENCGILGMRKIGQYLKCSRCQNIQSANKSCSREEGEKLIEKYANTEQRRKVFEILEEYGELSTPELKRLSDSAGITCGDEVARQMRPLTVTYWKNGSRVKFWDLCWRHKQEKVLENERN